ncbi:unnamed protein product [Orchesella dallaii]|uniref:Acetyl-coenzyme A transporter 1 n=1 Tax=Orchesella dallaii TaxID=48710 RepID=A0ABP1RBC4_9HEXA
MASEKKGCPKPSSIWKDLPNLSLLLLLYILQGIPLGLIASIPMILQNRNYHYSDQAKFSFAYWPFSLKLLWAPIVDSLYVSKFGRRKTWLVPMQYLLGIFMICLSFSVNNLIDNGGIYKITGVFFALNFLAATQDIAVDGWALTMLSRENVALASTCNSVGQTAGYFLGYVLFLALESPDFCNNYLRAESSEMGLITLPGFLFFWGIVFMITTTLVLAKHESSDESEITVFETYKLLTRIVSLKKVRKLVFFLITCKIGFAAADSVTGLKLVEYGVPKSKLALLAVPMTPLQIVLPLFISKYTKDRPLGLFIKAMPIRLLFGAVFIAVVEWTKNVIGSKGEPGVDYYVMIVAIYAIHQIAVYTMFVSIMSFFAQISDPSVGGTYMTLLNTICNLGGNWPSTVALWLVDPLTTKVCNNDPANDCSSAELEKVCEDGKSSCSTITDGYNIESVACIIIGFLWLFAFGRRAVQQLEGSGGGSDSQSGWRVLEDSNKNGKKVKNGPMKKTC